MRSLLTVLGAIASHPLNRGQKAWAIMRYLRWQVTSRLTSAPIVYEWVNGSKFLVSSGERGLTGNIYTGFQEYAEMAFVIHALRREDLFVDVGANVGSYTVLACAAVGARGYCLEPVPATYARLVENVRLNHLDERVRCLNVGAGSAPGVLAFSSDMDAGNRVLAEGEARADRIEVPVTTLDALLEGQSPTMIKVDVEGYETSVLMGAHETLQKPSLHSVIMEVNGSGARFGFDDSQLFLTMEGYGFSAYTYAPESRDLVALVPGHPYPDNVLFVRDHTQVRALLREAPVFNVQRKRL